MNSSAPDHYFEQAEDWDDELIRGLRSQRNIWMIVGLISLLIALMAVAAVVGLTPLKRVEPIDIVVD